MAAVTIFQVDPQLNPSRNELMSNTLNTQPSKVKTIPTTILAVLLKCLEEVRNRRRWVADGREALLVASKRPSFSWSPADTGKAAHAACVSLHGLTPPPPRALNQPKSQSHQSQYVTYRGI